MFGEIRGNSIQAHNCEIGQRLGKASKWAYRSCFWSNVLNVRNVNINHPGDIPLILKIMISLHSNIFISVWGVVVVVVVVSVQIEHCVFLRVFNNRSCYLFDIIDMTLTCCSIVTNVTSIRIETVHFAKVFYVCCIKRTLTLSVKFSPICNDLLMMKKHLKHPFWLPPRTVHF